MKRTLVTLCIILVPLFVSCQIKDLSINKVKYCETLIDDFNKELKAVLGNEAGTFWLERKLLFYKNQYGEIFRFPIDRIHPRLQKESTYLEIQTYGNERDVYWSSKKTNIPQFTSRTSIYWKPKKYISDARMESHLQMLNEMITCLQERLSKKDLKLGIKYIDSLKIVKGIAISKSKSRKKPKKEKFTDINIFSSGSKSKKKLTAAEKANMKRFQDSLKREVDKAWAGAKKATKCSKCAGYGHIYTSKKVNNTYVEFSEDDMYLYKKTTKTTSNHHRKIECYQCKGTGKVKK